MARSAIPSSSHFGWHADDLLLWKHMIEIAGEAEVESQEFYDCAVVDRVLLRRQYSEPSEKHSCTGTCSSSAGHHQWDKFKDACSTSQTH